MNNMTITSQLLSQVQFSADVAFVDGAFKGSLDVTRDIRETYLNNTLDAGETLENSRAAVAEMLVGEVVVSSCAVPEGFDAKAQAVRIVSMEGDVQAGELEMAFALTSKGENELMLNILPMKVAVVAEYENRGHGLDLISAACWLAQDIVSEMFLNSQGTTTIALSVNVQSENTTEAMAALVHGITSTLEVTGKAFCNEAAAPEAANTAFELAKAA